jgi:hypothetical protein
MAFDRGSSTTGITPSSSEGVINFAPRANAPTAPFLGDVYFDSTDNKLKLWNGSVWQDLNKDSLLLE